MHNNPQLQHIHILNNSSGYSFSAAWSHDGNHIASSSKKHELHEKHNNKGQDRSKSIYRDLSDDEKAKLVLLITIITPATNS